MILRHYFCSVCVMAGIDFIPIAAWLGHKDGGIPIDKVCGHLLDQHRSKAAKQVRFGHGFSRGSERTRGGPHRYSLIDVSTSLLGLCTAESTRFG